MRNNIGLFVTGIGIGVFLGLSESPILLQILIPLLTVIVGLLSILTGQKSDDKPISNESTFLSNRNISPFPIMWVVLGMVAGSFLGLLAKNYDITGRGEMFGSPTSTTIAEVEPKKDADSGRSTTVLHESQEELCNKPNICILKGAELVSACRYVEYDDVKRIVRSSIINTDSLKSKINQICNCK